MIVPVHVFVSFCLNEAYVVVNLCVYQSKIVTERVIVFICDLLRPLTDGIKHGQEGSFGSWVSEDEILLSRFVDGDDEFRRPVLFSDGAHELGSLVQRVH